MSIEVIDTLKQKNNKNFPLIHCNDIEGGLYIKNNLEERDSIPVERRKEGMMCNVINDCVYELLGGTSNANWIKYNPQIDLSGFALKENVYTKEEVNNIISELNDEISSLEQRIINLENNVSSKKAIVGTFLSGEVDCGQGLSDDSNSFLSKDFKNKFGVDK